jgi:RNA polymerase sigma-70 factor (ECF subfamily)
MFSDDDLIKSIQEGRVQNFEILIHRYKNKIVNFIYKMIYDYDEALNIAQDTFLKVYENISRYKGESNFAGFLFTIAKNNMLNYLKKEKRKTNFSTLLARGESHKNLSLQDTQYQNLEKEKREELLNGAMKAIKEDQRLALILKVYLNYSYNQIADITGWSIPKIETLIFRAKTALKNEIILQERGNKNV